MTVVVRSRGVDIHHRVPRGLRHIVHDLDLEIEEGEAYGLVGPSGSGKSTIALALMGHFPRGPVIHGEQLEVAGKDLLALRGERLRRFRRDDIGVVFPDPSRALDPTANVGSQVSELHRLGGATLRAARPSTIASLAAVGFEDPEVVARRYPHELSGGQQQRIMIAMALAGEPRLLILDEPTTALDAVVQADILDMIGGLQAEHGFGSILISHDLSLVAARCDRVGELEDGRLRPAAVPVEEAAAPPRQRIVVAARTTAGDATRRSQHPPAVLVGSSLTKRFGATVALDDVNFHLGRGETLGVVGRTGSGKTTLGRVIAGLTPHEGTVEVAAAPSSRPVQVVFQSPDASLNPRRTVRQTLSRAIKLLQGETTPEILADRTRLPSRVLDSLPHELSSGQKQRVAIARAFAGFAPIVVCDEPTSSLDAPVRTAIIDLLIELQDDTGTALVFISHDLLLVQRMAHRIAVMHAGRIVETASTDDFFRAALHPAARDLVAASQRVLNMRGGSA